MAGTHQMDGTIYLIRQGCARKVPGATIKNRAFSIGEARVWPAGVPYPRGFPTQGAAGLIISRWVGPEWHGQAPGVYPPVPRRITSGQSGHQQEFT